MEPIAPITTQSEPQTDSFTVAYEQTEEDLLAMLLFISARKEQTGWKAIRRQLPQLLTLFGGLFVFVTFVSIGEFSLSVWRAILFAAIVSGVFVFSFSLLAVPSIHRWFKKRAARKLARTHSGVFLGHMQLTADSTGVAGQGPLGQTQRDWASIESVGGTDTHTFLVINNLTMYVIPRRAFSSDDAFQELRTSAAGYVAAAKSAPAPQRRVAGPSTFNKLPVGSQAAFAAKGPHGSSDNPYAAPRADGDMPPFWPAGALPLGESVAIDYVTTADDVVAMAIFQDRRLPSAWRRVLRILRDGVFIVVLGFPVFPVIPALGLAYRAGHWSVFLVLPILAAFPLLLLISMFYSRRRGIRKNTLKWLTETAAETLGPARMTIQPSGVTLTKPTRESHRPWNSNDRVVSTKSYAFVIQEKVIIYQIPCRAFPSNADFQKFIDLMRRYIEAAKEASRVPPFPKA